MGAPSAPRLTWQDSDRELPSYLAPASVLLVFLCGVTVLQIVHAGYMSVAHSLPVEAAIAMGGLLVALIAAYVALGDFSLHGRPSSLCTGAAFLILAAANAGQGLIPLLLERSPHLTGAGYVWTLESMVAAVILIAGAVFARRGLIVESRRRRPMLLAVVTLTVMIAVLLGIATFDRPANSGTAMPALHVVTAVLIFVAAGLWWRAGLERRRDWFVWLGLSLLIAAFAQIQFALQTYAPGIIQQGDIIQVVFYAGILASLAAEWGRNFQQVELQARELGVLHALMAAPVVGEIAAVIRHIEQVVGETLNADVRVTVFRADPRQPLPDAERISGEPFVEDGGLEVERIRPASSQSGMASLSLPLGEVGRLRGVLTVTRPATAAFTPRERRLLGAFAAQSAILLERSLLYQEVAAGAILQERSRLAREVHDGLAQHLAFLKMRIAWLRRSRGGIDGDQLEDVESVLETALIEARQAISTLRAQPGETSIGPAIRAYAEEFGQVSGLEVNVDERGELPEIGPRARVELMRIVQESLNNARKHAGTSPIDVLLGTSDEGLVVCVQDRGPGFSSPGGATGHFGLEIMRERAQSIGASLDVRSASGEGTQVTIRVPAADAEARGGTNHD